MRVTLLGSCAVFWLVAALAGCSGNVEQNDPGGSLGGSGNAGSSSTAGRTGAAGSGVGGSGVGGSGVGGSGVGGSGVGGSNAGAGSAGKGGGSAGAGGLCTDGQTSGNCDECVCAGGQWACSNVVCQKNCGGFIGQTCSVTEYCAYTAGQACGAADGSSTCQQRPGACDDIYSPVCGCDQKTYPSSCDAALHGQGVFAAGECPGSTAN
jgi:Kazal-type serine protease inhibitor domain